MEERRKMNLQLFAGEGGGAGGAGAQAGPGEGAQSANEPQPQQRRRSRGGEDLSGVVYGIQTQENVTETPEEQPQPDDGASEQTARMSFKDLIHSDEYKAEADEYIQNLVKDRLKGAKAQEATLAKMAPTIERIAQRYGVDATDLSAVDFEALNAQIDGDEVYLQEKAALNGVTVDVQRQLDEADRIKMSFERQQRENETRKAFDSIRQQAEAFKAIVPGFDLRAEMENPAFMQMIRPPQMGGSGLSVEAAYAALHYKDMMAAGMQAAAQQARQTAASTIRAGMQRPTENGATSNRAIETRSDPRTLSRNDRAEIRRRAANGEKISF